MARGDRFVLALRQRVVAAHQALQFGEFADHLGEQIGLGEPRGALRLLDIGADQRRELARPAARCARCARACVPSFSWNTICSNFGSRSSSLRLQIGLVEELRVGQPRADHALVAGDDRLAAVLGLGVGDQDEACWRACRSCGSRSTKHFWLLRMVARITSGGIARNASSNEPISTTGHSTRPATSSAGPRPRPARSPARRRGSWRRRG